MCIMNDIYSFNDKSFAKTANLRLSLLKMRKITIKIKQLFLHKKTTNKKRNNKKITFAILLWGLKLGYQLIRLVKKIIRLRLKG